MKNNRLILSFFILLSFVVASYFVFSDVFLGKEAYQPDIVNYKGGIKEVKDHFKEFNEESYWSNSMFGGMPTYQSGATYENDWIKLLDRVLRLNLPTPADYFFLLLMGFFILGITLFKNWKYAVLGAIFFSFSTYFFILVAAGHNSKLHSIAYFAPLLAGVLLIYKRKYFLGFLLYTIFLALELESNHIQMTYYLLLSLIIFFVFELIFSLKNSSIKEFIKATSLIIIGGLLALGMNANRLIPTYELAKESIRGKKSVIENKEKPVVSSGLSKEYITEWSYGKLETFNLFIPYFTGGGNGEKIELKNSIKAIEQNVPQEKLNEYEPLINNLSAYWGEQPMTFGPAYQGAVVIFLAFLGMFTINNRHKWWLFTATILSILLAWGKNFMPLTDFLIDYFPLYNKFRTVSSILVIAEYTIPVLAIMSVFYFLEKHEFETKAKQKYLIITASFTVLILLVFYFFGEDLFSFKTSIEKDLPQFLVDGLKKDRVELFKSDVLRTLILVSLTALALFIYSFKLLKSKEIVLIFIGVLAFLDLYNVNNRYLNESVFIDKRLNQNPFPTQLTESLIQKAQENPSVYQIISKVEVNKKLQEIKELDKTNYRVMNLLLSPFNEATTSFFHHSVGGYHAAKLRNFQDIIDTYLSNGINENILNLLNVKYFLYETENKEIDLVINPKTNGNAWFVKKVKKLSSEQDELLSLKNLDNKNEAIVNLNTKIINDNFSTTVANIKLKEYKPNKIVYGVYNSTNQFAVFSEIFYPHGWKAFIDGKEQRIIKTNFFLRGLEVPANSKEIIFEFKPKSVQYGVNISMISFLIFLLIAVIGMIYRFKTNQSKVG